MPGPSFGTQLEQLATEYTRIRTEMRTIQEKVQAVTATVKSDNGMLTVTVGPQGDIVALKVNNREYRKMAPAELANALTTTLARARAAVHEQMRGILTEFVPAGTTFDDVRAGTFDWSSALPAEPFSREELSRFTSRLRRAGNGSGAGGGTGGVGHG